MGITHWETSSFEMFESNEGTMVIEFSCPQCRSPLTTELETEDLSCPFEETCINCEATIFCQIKIVMDW